MHAGLAAERLGVYFLEREQDSPIDRKSDAVYRLEQAVDFYKSWGAHRKVSILLEEYAHIWPQPSTINIGQGDAVD